MAKAAFNVPATSGPDRYWQVVGSKIRSDFDAYKRWYMTLDPKHMEERANEFCLRRSLVDGYEFLDPRGLNTAVLLECDDITEALLSIHEERYPGSADKAPTFPQSMYMAVRDFYNLIAELVSEKADAGETDAAGRKESM